MRVWPVIVRELRQQSRQKATFNVRCVGAGLATLIAALIAPSLLSNPNLGGVLFRGLHNALFYSIWVLVPLSAADCISRERREGTLGLLFLTPLQSRDIVLAKALTNGLRALTVLLAVLPVLTICFLLGGVSWQQGAMAALVNLAAVAWSLGATLVASATTRTGLRALVTALLLTIGLMLVHAVVLGSLSAPGVFFSGNFFGFLDDRLIYGMAPIRMGARQPLGYGRGGGGVADMLSGAAMNCLVALLFFQAAILLAAALVRRYWREEPPPIWVQRTQATFCTPVVATGFFKRWMRRKIERNPMGWLEQRRWTGRIVTWAWFAIVISIYSAVFADINFLRDFSGLQHTVSWLMLGSVAMSAAGSFRRERESGVLELLLVAPVSSGNLIDGRLRGLVGQFLPAMATMLLIWLYFQSICSRYEDLGSVVFYGVTFLTLPCLGLYFSLRCRTFIGAFLLTVLCGMVLPTLGPGALSWLAGWLQPIMSGGLYRPRTEMEIQAVLGIAALQVVFAFLAREAMRRRLECRDFPLDRPAA